MQETSHKKASRISFL